MLPKGHNGGPPAAMRFEDSESTIEQSKEISDVQKAGSFGGFNMTMKNPTLSPQATFAFIHGDDTCTEPIKKSIQPQMSIPPPIQISTMISTQPHSEPKDNVPLNGLLKRVWLVFHCILSLTHSKVQRQRGRRLQRQVASCNQLLKPCVRELGRPTLPLPAIWHIQDHKRCCGGHPGMVSSQ